MSKKTERGGKGLTQGFVDDAVVGRHSDGNGLTLIVKEKGQGSWEWRGMKAGKRHEIGLGSASVLKLAMARDMAAKARLALSEGNDPKEVVGLKKWQKDEKSFILSDVIERKFESLKPTLKDGGKAGRWLSPLETLIIPTLGAVDVRDFDTDTVRNILKPVWYSKPSAAQKAFQRLKMCVEHAADEGAEVDENAFIRAKRLLGKQPTKRKHHPSTPYKEIPGLYKRLCEQEQSTAILALRFVMLTQHRAKPIREAQVSEIDLDAEIWIVPAEKLKALVGHAEDIRCPLPDEAVRVVELARQHRRGDTLFPAKRGIGFVSDVGMSKWMKKLEANGTTHGLRASFGDWARANHVPFDLAEACLQHAVGSKVAQAYRRDDQLEPRRTIMQSWSDYVTSETREIEATEHGKLRVIK